MIPRTQAQDTDWKAALRQSVTRPDELLELLELPKSRWLSGALRAAGQFPLRVPRGFINRMQKCNAHDPLLQQVMPLAVELDDTPGYDNDPVADGPSTAVPGLIHKYHRRALLISTGACAVHCRYCFRRHYPYADSHAGGRQLQAIYEYLLTHDELNEVILSGGDPLMLDDSQLERVLRKLSSVPHLRWIRVHSRLPIVLPERITNQLVQTLGCGLPVTLVTHCNHPNELDSHTRQALQTLQEGGIRLYNQSVLLKGINDDADTLCNLSHLLYETGVQPYYLHCLDRVKGAAHFDLDDETITSLYQQIQTQLSGLLLPRLVRDVPGRPAKVHIN